MKRVYNAVNLPDAHLILDLLRQAGVAAHVLNTHAVGAMGEISISAACPQVWVTQPHQEQLARKLIDEYQRRRPLSGTKACGACNETSPGEFDFCWNCGGLLPLDA